MSFLKIKLQMFGCRKNKICSHPVIQTITNSVLKTSKSLPTPFHIFERMSIMAALPYCWHFININFSPFNLLYLQSIFTNLQHR